MQTPDVVHETPLNPTELYEGVLLGTAIGDALGLACEGLSAAVIAKRFGRVDRYRLFSSVGWVSDDTEQSALVAQSIVRSRGETQGCVRVFRRALLGWFWRLPWGIGLATLRACLRLTLGLRSSGVNSAGNGAAMRSAIVGAFFRDDATRRRDTARALAQVTHRDPRKVRASIRRRRSSVPRASSSTRSGWPRSRSPRAATDRWKSSCPP